MSVLVGRTCARSNMCEKSSSETQGQIKGERENLNGRKNIYGTKKRKERREEPLGTMSYQTSSKRSPPFWLLIGARKTQVFWHQSEAPGSSRMVRNMLQSLPFDSLWTGSLFGEKVKKSRGEGRKPVYRLPFESVQNVFSWCAPV